MQLMFASKDTITMTLFYLGRNFGLYSRGSHSGQLAGSTSEGEGSTNKAIG